MMIAYISVLKRNIVVIAFGTLAFLLSVDLHSGWRCLRWLSFLQVERKRERGHISRRLGRQNNKTETHSMH